MKTETSRNHKTPPFGKQMLAEVPWMGYFRTNEHGQILSKTALIKGDKIGAYNPLGQLIWVEKNLIVIVVS